MSNERGPLVRPGSSPWTGKTSLFWAFLRAAWRDFADPILPSSSRLRGLRASAPGREAFLALRTTRRRPGALHVLRQQLVSASASPEPTYMICLSFRVLPCIPWVVLVLQAGGNGTSISIPIPISIAMDLRSVLSHMPTVIRLGFVENRLSGIWDGGAGRNTSYRFARQSIPVPRTTSA